jgi:hypothetical protein
VRLAHACAIPLRLSDIAALDASELEEIVQMSLHAPDMQNMPDNITAHALYQAIARVEAMAAMSDLTVGWSYHPKGWQRCQLFHSVEQVTPHNSA